MAQVFSTVPTGSGRTRKIGSKGGRVLRPSDGGFQAWSFEMFLPRLMHGAVDSDSATTSHRPTARPPVTETLDVWTIEGACSRWGGAIGPR